MFDNLAKEHTIKVENGSHTSSQRLQKHTSYLAKAHQPSE
jgi:hypothetical protein